ncbi:hypothetical protein SPSYN_03089 [Sporotomaculum syntrophicum]|uniref:Acyltransferase family protein n=2 Tax=Sporotomaculum syntrophicum TaxID=182264 RepID=A0A9D3AV76_9FIRM|nr:hypothetical protein [Sporotomaculum syntrophicum]KAF1083740.1 hypothetical protein SPSYN_03089 [Sporotomaculum syntrophicum]
MWAYLFTVALEMLTSYLLTSFLQIGNFQASYWVKEFFNGGSGPGSYFVPLVLQIIFFLPVLYILAQKNANLMLIGAFALNILFELGCYYWAMPQSTYRFIFLRYLFAIALGIWLAKAKHINWYLVTAGALLSLLYITGVSFYDLRPPVQPDWSPQNAPAFFWPFMVVLLGLKLLPEQANGPVKLIAALGKASYHIFLSQMVYFYYMDYLFAKLPLGLYILINLTICLSAGYLFYLLEQKLRAVLNTKKEAGYAVSQ